MKRQITVTIDKSLLSWVDRRVDNREFANRSHGFELLMAKEMAREGETWSDERAH
ncbi:MAG: ribbon-helix-helix domain-containing protein [Nanoarchaeota archaeon]